MPSDLVEYSESSNACPSHGKVRPCGWHRDEGGRVNSGVPSPDIVVSAAVDWPIAAHGSLVWACVTFPGSRGCPRSSLGSIKGVLDSDIS